MELKEELRIDLRTKLVNFSLLGLTGSIALITLLHSQSLDKYIPFAFLSSFFFLLSCTNGISNILKLYETEKNWLVDLAEKYSSEWRGWYIFLAGTLLLEGIALHIFLTYVGWLN